ncbi:MAG: glycoside hydrolase family 18 protein [Chitinophagaceae bacterium]
MRVIFLPLICLLCLLCIYPVAVKAQKKRAPVTVIAYYSGNESRIDGYPVEKLTHIIYSFCHLKGNRLNVDNAGDTATIHKLVAMKKRNPALKVMLSLGGWGGCKPCSDVFATAQGRLDFASSVKEINSYFKTDGIDLDWEYPAIPGHPGHPYRDEDRPNFTALVQALRDSLGKDNEISFAAGGFPGFLEKAVEWDKLAPLIDRVNLMSYDLVNGFSTVTGHHTPLYSTSKQVESADQAVKYLAGIGFPLNKVVIGAAFYARTWEQVEGTNNGLYQSGRFKSFVPYSIFKNTITAEKGYQFFQDKEAAAAYAYNPKEKIFATYDDMTSIAAKTKYVKAKGLNGIMFWELTLDITTGGLLDKIHSTLHP